MKTVTIIKGQYLGYEILIPIFEDIKDNFEGANYIRKEIDENSGIELVRNPSWCYLKDEVDRIEFLNNFFQKTESRKVMTIDCLIKDHTNPKSIETIYGKIELPSEYPCRLYAVVKDAENPFMPLDDAVVPVLIFNVR